MKKLLSILILFLTVFAAKSQIQKINSIEINKDSLILNYERILIQDNSGKLISFNVTAKLSNGLIKQTVSNNGELTEAQIVLIQEATTGDQVYFDEIYIENSAGEKEQLSFLKFNFKE